MSAQPALGVTPTQTVGPFFAPALLRDVQNIMVTDKTAGQRIRVEGRVTDGAGNVVPDAMIEIWQANSHGRFNHPRDTRDLPLDPEFSGFGRAPAPTTRASTGSRPSSPVRFPLAAKRARARTAGRCRRRTLR